MFAGVKNWIPLLAGNPIKALRITKKANNLDSLLQFTELSVLEIIESVDKLPEQVKQLQTLEV